MWYRNFPVFFTPNHVFNIMGELLNIMATVTKETNVILPMMPKIIGNQFSEFGGGGTGVQSSQHSLSWQYPGRGI